jgi:hypothetical protein
MGGKFKNEFGRVGLILGSSGRTSTAQCADVKDSQNTSSQPLKHSVWRATE